MTKKRVRPKEGTYHHGDLRQALLQCAESILRREGLDALSLRAIARAAGVSHAAPAHHFPDLASLLSALAALGFDRLTDTLVETMKGTEDIRIELAKAYICFAKANPALYQLMWDSTRLDSKNDLLMAARKRGISVLAKTSGANMENPSLSQVGAMAANWGLLHGLSLLLITGRIGLLTRSAPHGTTEKELVEAALHRVFVHSSIST